MTVRIVQWLPWNFFIRPRMIDEKICGAVFGLREAVMSRTVLGSRLVTDEYRLLRLGPRSRSNGSLVSDAVNKPIQYRSSVPLAE